MKTLLALFATASIALAQDAAPTLKPGDAVTVDALAAATWLQGEAPKAWEPGKVYVIECWATWCGPCVASIPHISELHTKYTEKGLRVMGMNVWEDGQEKVGKFVKEHAQGAPAMTYPVAYVGKGGAFEKSWLVPAGVHGIPHAFIVRDGKLLFTSHPARLSDALIEKLLAGGDRAKEAADSIAKAESAQNQQRDAMRKAMIAFEKAQHARDTAAMSAAIKDAETAGMSKTVIESMHFDWLIATKDFDAAAKIVAEPPGGLGMLRLHAINAALNEDCPADFVKAVAAAATKATSQDNIPALTAQVALLQWKAGDKEAAKACAKRAADAKNSLPAEPFQRLVKALDDGTPPTLAEWSAWLREAMTKKSGAHTTPAKPVE